MNFAPLLSRSNSSSTLSLAASALTLVFLSASRSFRAFINASAFSALNLDSFSAIRRAISSSNWSLVLPALPAVEEDAAQLDVRAKGCWVF